MRLDLLSRPIQKNQVHWRPQKIFERDGKHISMALAYLDSRDVQDRFDIVCGHSGWQSKYKETVKGRMLASIGVKVGDEWVWKSDGAGNTDIEGEKGGISDAFKRAAVHWGVGRYLYRVGAPWVECEVTPKGGFKKWSENPWDKVSNCPEAPEDIGRRLFLEIRDAADRDVVVRNNDNALSEIAILAPEAHAHIKNLLEESK